MNSMVAQCQSCLTEFELDPHKVPLDGLRARCSVCSAVITVPARSSAPVSTSYVAESQTWAGARVSAAVSNPVSTNTVYVSETQGAHGSPEFPTQVDGAQADASLTDASPIPAPDIATLVPLTTAEVPRRKPINPFLSKDPSLRAKRLARALVSDIVAYHPAKHAEGLRDGTLKVLFRDEIKKSYEEYVEQIGHEFAQSTTHFQEALNDILASGKKLF